MGKVTKEFQAAARDFYRHFHVPIDPPEVDGELGPNSRYHVERSRYFVGYASKYVPITGKLTREQLETLTRRLRHPLSLMRPIQVARGLRRRRAARRQAARPLRVRALDVARTLVGVMEHGGNNVGPVVSKIIRANGGVPGEPWCGDFTAYCYRQAGSVSVQRAWAGVFSYLGLPNVFRISDPEPGDLVRFRFGHIGLFVRWIDRNTIETIEGNTGASGAVSDSTTGGDGVYVKRRSITLVYDFLRVTK